MHSAGTPWRVPSSIMEVLLPPSCGFPPKSFPLKREPTISGDTFGTRARGRPRTAPPRRRHVMPLAMRPLRDQMAHCRRTTVQPSALTRSPPTFKRRQAACESLAGRLHFERDNIVSGDVTLGFFVKMSNVHLFRACLNTMKPLSKMVLRAAHPNLHSGRLRPALASRGALRDLASQMKH